MVIYTGYLYILEVQDILTEGKWTRKRKNLKQGLTLVLRKVLTVFSGSDLTKIINLTFSLQLISIAQKI